MKRALGVVACVLSAGVSIAAPATADPFWLYQGNAAEPYTRGHVYAGYSTFGGVQQLPRVRSTLSLFDPGGALHFASTFDRDLAGVQPGGMIGYVFADGSTPAWLGQRLRIELSGDALFYSARSRRSIDLASGTGVTIAGISGTTLYSNSFGPDVSYVEEMRIRREGFGLALTLASDHPVGPDLVLSPSISVFGGHTDDAYRLKGSFFNLVEEAPVQINEWLTTNEVGLRIGLAAQWQFAPGWTLNLAGHGGVVHLRSRLKGEDCLGDPPSGFGHECGPGLGAKNYVTSAVSTRDSAFGFRGGASASISADLRYAIVTIGGSFRYDSHIPSIANPQFRSQTITGVMIPNGNPAARIRYAGGLAYGGFVRITVPLTSLGL